ncbi:MAG TPA: POTRA domain-containing protein [Acidobacteriota bacterium]|nr:POTRA domain-containing protein [Acidobacteriota bacterium]
MKKRFVFYLVATIVLLSAFVYLRSPADDSGAGSSQVEAKEPLKERGQPSTAGNSGPAFAEEASPDGSMVPNAGFKADRKPSRRLRYSVEFVGNEDFSDRVLESVLRLPLAPSDSQTLGAIIEEDVTAFYRRHGYLSFEIHQIQISLGNPVSIRCELREGEQSRYGTVEIVSDDPQLAGTLRRLAHKGAVINREEYRRFVAELTRERQNQGYLDFQVRSSISFGRTPNRPDLKIEVIPSQRYMVGEITFSSGVPRIEGIDRLSGFPYSRPALEPYLRRAGLPWDVVWLNKNSAEAVVDIRIRNPLPDDGET